LAGTVIRRRLRIRSIQFHHIADDSYFSGSSSVTPGIRDTILAFHDHQTRLQTTMKTDEQFDRILKMLEENKQGLVEIKSAMTEMRVAKDEFEAWKPGVDKSVADLQIAVDNLGVRFD